MNHLLEHNFLSPVQLESLSEDLGRVPLSDKAPIFNEDPPIVGRPQDSRARRTVYGNYGGRNQHKHNPNKIHDLPVIKRITDCVLETAMFPSVLILAEVPRNHTLELSFSAHFPKTPGVFLALIVTVELFLFACASRTACAQIHSHACTSQGKGTSQLL